MTTENTDAGTRILTRTIRKLTARLAIADATVDQKQKVINDRASEIDAARVALNPPSGRMPTWERMVMADPLCKLAEKRMAELAELREGRAAANRNAAQSADLMGELQERIDKALVLLPSSLADKLMTFDQIMTVRAILRGES